MDSERSVEIPWAIANARGPVLDVGCVESAYVTDLPRPRDGIDVREDMVPGLRQQYVGDIRNFVFPKLYRTVLAISSLEHVGLGHHRYGTTTDDAVNGDRMGLEGCVRAARKGGQVLVSVPFGATGFYGWFRQYGSADLEDLFDGHDFSFEVWRQGQPWKQVEPQEAENLSYNIPHATARAVALVTVRV